MSFSPGLPSAEESTLVGSIGVIINLWFKILAEPLSAQMEQWIVSHGNCSMSCARGEGNQGFIYYVMTNSSPEENSREAANGTIKLVIQGEVILDIFIKLNDFIAKFLLPLLRNVTVAFLETDLTIAVFSDFLYLCCFFQQHNLFFLTA